MQLDHSFTVPVNTNRAWAALLDFERVAPCLPGATLQAVDGDMLHGAVKVKLGPVLLNYLGNATVLERDPASRVMVMEGRAKDSRGNGTAAARITARLEALDDANTTVHVRTELDVTGRPAQFGRGLMQDVGNKIVDQFATRLAEELTAAPPAASAGRPTAPHGPVEDAPTGTTASAANEPLDLGGMLPRPSGLQTVLATCALVLTGAIVIRLMRRH